MTRFAILLVFLSSVANAQELPPPPKPGDDGPSLEVTMKFIEERIDSDGAASWTSTTQDVVKGTTADPIVVSVEESPAKEDFKNCTLSYHWKATMRGRPTRDRDVFVSLKSVEKIKLSLAQDFNNEEHAKNGHPELVESQFPNTYLIRLLTNDGYSPLIFPDDEIAHRVAKAFLHAVELCGGGSMDPF